MVPRCQHGPSQDVYEFLLMRGGYWRQLSIGLELLAGKQREVLLPVENEYSITEFQLKSTDWIYPLCIFLPNTQTITNASKECRLMKRLEEGTLAEKDTKRFWKSLGKWQRNSWSSRCRKMSPKYEQSDSLWVESQLLQQNLGDAYALEAPSRQRQGWGTQRILLSRALNLEQITHRQVRDEERFTAVVTQWLCPVA